MKAKEPIITQEMKNVGIDVLHSYYDEFFSTILTHEQEEFLEAVFQAMSQKAAKTHGLETTKAFAKTSI